MLQILERPRMVRALVVGQQCSAAQLPHYMYGPRDRHALNFVQDKFKRKNYFSNRLSKLKCNYNIMKVEQSICEGRTIQL